MTENINIIRYILLKEKCNMKYIANQFCLDDKNTLLQSEPLKFAKANLHLIFTMRKTQVNIIK